jgi:hypothetical protein
MGMRRPLEAAVFAFPTGALKRLDSHTFEVIQKRQNKVVIIGTRTVSKDGRTAIVTNKGLMPQVDRLTRCWCSTGSEPTRPTSPLVLPTLLPSCHPYAVVAGVADGRTTGRTDHRPIHPSWDSRIHAVVDYTSAGLRLQAAARPSGDKDLVGHVDDRLPAESEAGNWAAPDGWGGLPDLVPSLVLLRTTSYGRLS